MKSNNKINFNLLYDKNNSLHKKIKIEQFRKETTSKVGKHFKLTKRPR